MLATTIHKIHILLDFVLDFSLLAIVFTVGTWEELGIVFRVLTSGIVFILALLRLVNYFKDRKENAKKTE